MPCRPALFSARLPALLLAALAVWAPPARAQAPSFLHFAAATAAPRGYSAMCAAEPALCARLAPPPPDAQSAAPAISLIALAPIDLPEPLPATPACTAPPPPALGAIGTLGQSAAAAPCPAPARAAMAVASLALALTTAPPPPEPALASLLARINGHVNRQVRQRPDPEQWRPAGQGPDARGDCKDIAIEKRLELIAAGFPAERLFFAVVFREGVGLHAVLVARLGSGDVVLDSRVDYIERWQRAGYSWIAAQSPDDPARWFAVA